MAKYGDTVYISGGDGEDVNAGKAVYTYDLKTAAFAADLPLMKYRHFYHSCGIVEYVQYLLSFCISLGTQI